MTDTDRKYFSDAGFTECIIPEGIKTLPALFFDGRKQLSKVMLPTSLVTIGERAFRGCESITELPVLPKKTKYFHSHVFSGTGIRHLVAPKVNYRGDLSGDGKDSAGAFADCKQLQTVIYPEGVSPVGASWFKDCTSLTDVVLSSDVKAIRPSAFYGCTSLVNINLDHVTAIFDAAFYECTSLGNINLNNVGTILSDAFYGCTSLKKVEFIAHNIESRAFYGCTGLESVTIKRSQDDYPDGIESAAFSNCPNLLNIYCDFAEGEVAGAPWGATNATIHYNSTGPEEE